MIAPLDWGLGHATRCVPIIEKFLSFGFKVIIAATGDQKLLIQEKFPDLEMLELSGYSVHYGTNGVSTLLKIFLQIPKILIAINRENRWLARVVRNYGIDLVFSDNRYGMHHSSTLNIFMTHQLQVKSFSGRWADAFLRRLHYFFIRRFDCCWVPDTPDAANSFGGLLSHPSQMPPLPVAYTGPLSALPPANAGDGHQLLILLSGPEPQRSIFEAIVLKQLNNYTGEIILVRGLPSGGEALELPKNVTSFNYISGGQLGRCIAGASIVISRAGYSTVMDLLPAGKKCIMVPTPGQTEQVYLAQWLSRRQCIICSAQDDFQLEPLLKRAASLSPPAFPPANGPALDEAIARVKSLLMEKRGEKQMKRGNNNSQ